MGKGRIEAFSDGVIAIIITIMVLELKVPHGDEPAELKPLIPVFISYILSFVNIGIYWNNHHHLFQAVQRINGKIMWANIHLLFWLSLMPFATAWVGENNFTEWPMALFGVILLMSGVAYYFLSQTIIHFHGKKSKIAEAIGSDWKGIISVVIYFVAVFMAFINAWVSLGLYFLVAVIWFIPDSRIEKNLEAGNKN
ncbi:MAG TPA: TMEM175 family protein [Panacibacter sp.]|nr:TMEM175 family protein [Panacibacter sp.]